jgi:hypothetical protein
VTELRETVKIVIEVLLLGPALMLATVVCWRGIKEMTWKW